MPYTNEEKQGMSKNILFDTVSLHSHMIIFIPLKYIKMAGLNGLPLNKLVIQFSFMSSMVYFILFFTSEFDFFNFYNFFNTIILLQHYIFLI